MVSELPQIRLEMSQKPDQNAGAPELSRPKCRKINSERKNIFIAQKGISELCHFGPKIVQKGFMGCFRL